MPSALGTENPLQHNTLYLTNAFSTKSSLGLSHPPLSFYENVHLNCNSSKLPSLTRPTFKEKQPLQNRDSLYFTDTTSSNSSIGVSTSSTVSMSLPLSFTSSLPDSDATSRSKLHNLQNIEYASHQRQFLNYRSTNVTAIHQISTDPSSQESFYTSSYPSNIPHSNSGCAPPNSVFPIHNSSFTPSSLPFSEYIPAYQSYSMFPSTDSPCCCCSYPSNVPYTDNQWTQRHLAFPAYNSTSPYPSFPCTSIPSSEYIPPCQTCTNDLSAWKSCCYSSYPSNVSYTNDQWAQYYPTFPIYSSTLPHSSFAEKLMASSEYIPHCQSYSTYPSACNSCCHPPNTLSVPYSNLVWAPANPTFPIYNSTSTHSSIPSSEYIAPCQSYSTFPSACNSCCYSSNTSTMPYSNSVWTPSNPAFPIYNSASSQSPFTSSSIPSSEYKNPQWTQSNPICNSSSLQFSSSTDPQYSSTPYYFPEVHPSHQSLSDNSRPSDTSFLNSRSNSQPYSSSNSSTTYPYFIPPKNTATLPEYIPTSTTTSVCPSSNSSCFSSSHPPFHDASISSNAHEKTSNSNLPHRALDTSTFASHQTHIDVIPNSSAAFNSPISSLPTSESSNSPSIFTSHPKASSDFPRKNLKDLPICSLPISSSISSITSFSESVTDDLPLTKTSESKFLNVTSPSSSLSTSPLCDSSALCESIKITSEFISLLAILQSITTSTSSPSSPISFSLSENNLGNSSNETSPSISPSSSTSTSPLSSTCSSPSSSTCSSPSSSPSTSPSSSPSSSPIPFSPGKNALLNSISDENSLNVTSSSAFSASSVSNDFSSDTSETSKHASTLPTSSSTSSLPPFSFSSVTHDVPFTTSDIILSNTSFSQAPPPPPPFSTSSTEDPSSTLQYIPSNITLPTSASTSSLPPFPFSSVTHPLPTTTAEIISGFPTLQHSSSTSSLTSIASDLSLFDENTFAYPTPPPSPHHLILPLDVEMVIDFVRLFYS